MKKNISSGFSLLLLLSLISNFALGQSITLDPSATGQGKLRVKSNVQTYGSISTTQTQGGLDFRNTEPANGDGSTGNLIGGIGTDNHNLQFYTHADYNDGNIVFKTPLTSNGYLSFMTQNSERIRVLPNGIVGIGISNPTLATLVVGSKIGNTHAIFGENTSGVSIESNYPGIHFNSYFNGSRKTLSTGYTSGAEMNPTTGTYSIYTSPASTVAGSTAAVYSRLTVDKNGLVSVPGFTKLGDDIDAPKIKMKELSGNSNTVLSHGLADLSKIISVSVLIEDALGALTPDGSQQPNYKYSYYVDLSGVHFQFLASPESISVSNRPARVLITYKE